MDIYRERAHLVSLLSRIFPSYLARPDDASEGFDLAVFVDTHEGQLSWHLANKDVDLFDHLKVREVSGWDGHTTEEKYARIDRISPRKAGD